VALFIPSTIVLVLFMVNMNEAVKDVQYNARLVDHLEVLDEMAGVVHEFQLERDTTVLYFESLGQEYIDELTKQWQSTDAIRQQFEDYIVNHDSDIMRTAEFDLAVKNMDMLNEKRIVFWEIYDVMNSDEVKDYYKNLVDSYLNVYVELVRQSRREDFYFELLAYVMYVTGKELAGAERALGVEGFQNQQWTVEHFRSYAYFATAQEVWLAVAEIYFPKEILTKKQDIWANAPEVANVYEWRADLMSYDYSNYTTTGSDEWFANCTTRINLMLDVSNELDAELRSETEVFFNTSQLVFVSICVVIIGAFVFSDNFTTLIMWRLVKLREVARNLKYQRVTNKKKQQQGRRGRRRGKR